ncbi:sensor domain-containing diguanylate cyclase [Ferrimonas senticii]|uniref:GGDEF domain-containing protein n=1 Tax=Ferrimonas senticii TaxID=394566 RepID=UPI0004159269|nr:diguanylate cyclase [Ferrimonas senticii]
MLPLSISTNRITQARYQLFHHQQLYHPNGYIILVAAALFALFGIYDLFALADYGLPVTLLRWGLCGVFCLTWFATRESKPPSQQIVETVTLISAGLFLTLVGRFAIHLGNDNYHGGTILLLIYTSAFSRLSLRYSLLVIAGIVVPYVAITAPILLPVDFQAELDRLVIYLSAGLLCAVGALRKELEARTLFTQARQIRSQGFRLKRHAQVMQRLSEHDGLTGLYNRTYLNQRLQRHRRHEPTQMVMMVDIDHFKAINDQFGHQTGDLILKEIATLLRQQLPAHWDCIRYGGEEFLVLAPTRDLRQPQRLLQACQSHQFAHGQPLTLSIGTADHLTSMSLTDSIASADAALYLAKQSGRNRHLHQPKTAT